MYLTYIDESGKAERSDPEPEYVLAALTINESAWKDVDSRVRGLKQKYFPNEKVAYTKMERDFLEVQYEVMFSNGSKVEFLKNGEWKDVDCKFSEVPADIIPQAIRTHIASLYPDAKVLQIDRDSRGYEVQLNNRLELSYNTSFQLTDIDD